MRPASRTTTPRHVSYTVFLIALIVMIGLYLTNFVVLSTRQLINWLCLWLDRWFDLVGWWGGMDTPGQRYSLRVRN